MLGSGRAPYPSASRFACSATRYKPKQVYSPPWVPDVRLAWCRNCTDRLPSSTPVLTSGFLGVPPTNWSQYHQHTGEVTFAHTLPMRVAELRERMDTAAKAMLLVCAYPKQNGQNLVLVQHGQSTQRDNHLPQSGYKGLHLEWGSEALHDSPVHVGQSFQLSSSAELADSA
eukprot:6458406-Amphidinium_carterae.1